MEEGRRMEEWRSSFELTDPTSETGNVGVGVTVAVDMLLKAAVVGLKRVRGRRKGREERDRKLMDVGRKGRIGRRSTEGVDLSPRFYEKERRAGKRGWTLDLR